MADSERKLVEGAEEQSNGAPTPGTVETERAEYLFTVSSFVMVAVSVFFVFGGFMLPRSLFAPVPGLTNVRNQLVCKAISMGVLMLLVGMLLKLYAMLTRMKRTHRGDTIPERTEWLCKVASGAFAVAATLIVIATLVFWPRQFAGAGEVLGGRFTAALRQTMDALSIQALGLAAFLLILANLSLIQVISLKHGGEPPPDESKKP